MYRIGKKVKVPLNIGDEIQYGWIMGVEKIQNGYYLGSKGIKEFKERFTRCKYKVIYERANRVHEKWFLDKEMEKVNEVE